MRVRDPETGRFIKVEVGTNPREVYEDEILEALYEDIRGWPEVMKLDSSDPDVPKITFWPVISEYPYHPRLIEPATFLVDYRYREDVHIHWTEHVRVIEGQIPYQHWDGHRRRDLNWRDDVPGVPDYSRGVNYVGRVIPKGSLCHGGFDFFNQDPFRVFERIRQWYLGVIMHAGAAIFHYDIPPTCIDLLRQPDSKLILMSNESYEVVPLTRDLLRQGVARSVY